MHRLMIQTPRVSICGPLVCWVRLLFLSVVLSFAGVTGAWGALENPAPNTAVSGIGVISGVECDAQTVTIQIDDLAPLEAAYGTGRNDTMAACGDTDNGFGLLFNWNLLASGSHIVRAFADGTLISQHRVTVVPLGEEFRTDLSGQYEVSDFPGVGESVQVIWQQEAQNFLIRGDLTASGGDGGSLPRILEIPPAGSFQSGLGVISGVVCDALTVTTRSMPCCR